MDYAMARNEICDGDLIAVRGRRGIVAVLTRLLTRSPYTHCAVAVWVDGGLWAAEINGGGNHLVPVSQIDQDFDVFRSPVVNMLDVRMVIFELLRDHRAYAVLELLRVAVYYLTGIVLTKRFDGALICNEFAAEVYRQAGRLPSLPPIAAPKDLCAALSLKLEVRHADRQQ